MRIVILGAGLLGVSSAWYLAADGHQVTLIDRQPGAGLETSFANGGQISVSHAEPWANPQAPLKILSWLGRADAPLLWHGSLQRDRLAWGMAFLRECLPARARRNTADILHLAQFSRACLHALRTELGLDYQQSTRGILHYFTAARGFVQAQKSAALIRALGGERSILDAAACLQLEPALAHSQIPIVGGAYAATDESGDAHLFTRSLAEHCAQRGVTMRYGCAVQALEAQGGHIRAVRLTDGEAITADAYVVALGAWSTQLVAPLGLRLTLQPAKGYSITLTLEEGQSAPQISLTDESHKIVFSRLGQRLRVAGTAEFAGFDTQLRQRRCDLIKQRVSEIFPQLRAALEQAESWSGLRPATPSNVPLIGATRYANLYLNTGHGTLGWTLACGSGKLLADLIGQRPTAVDARAYRPRV